MTITLAALAALMFGIGTYLVLQRKLSRIIIGIGLLSHGANVLFLGAGRSGRPPFIKEDTAAEHAALTDPLPHAMVLTAIVISFGVTALLLALAYRSWLLTDDDEVEDDVSDRVVAGGGFLDREIRDADAVIASVIDPEDV
ncbi:MAG: NADH-quinone oxidoreductase subunit K [Microthrixaceae bacterium]|nr:NADH-quinone oxidoreductase subunit K [Microthrixaceae bacterium]MCO5313176.1 NADH-quinone oxidoreductase subunit K [Microthrixaceae bacterium]HPB44995.1 NADH-quinone oxidoreductase subunit K [Microthrixaceae bacterium]